MCGIMCTSIDHLVRSLAYECSWFLKRVCILDGADKSICLTRAHALSTGKCIMRDCLRYPRAELEVLNGRTTMQQYPITRSLCRRSTLNAVTARSTKRSQWPSPITLLSSGVMANAAVSTRTCADANNISIKQCKRRHHTCTHRCLPFTPHLHPPCPPAYARSQCGTKSLSGGLRGCYHGACAYAYADTVCV